MKNLKSIIAILAISLATTFSTTANEKETTKKTTNLRSEIVNMLGKKLNLEVDKTSTAEISFMINKKDEVVIVSVDTNVAGFQSLVKNKLNYKKIDAKGAKKGEIYIVPVTLKSK